MSSASSLAGRKSPAPNNVFGGRGNKNDAPRGGAVFGGGNKQPSSSRTPAAPSFDKRFQNAQRKKNERPVERNQNRVTKNRSGPSREPTEQTKRLSEFAFNFANKLNAQLEKDKVNPPKWLDDMGNPSKRGAVENLKDSYKKYRTRVYDVLRKAELIDDPEKRRKLEDALPFKGVCEDMCPEFEQVSRIAEYDVKAEEKQPGSDGNALWPEPSRMVKKFGRSAAGQDAPLPMDVRSVDALRRTTDYLFNDLLQSDNNLPSMHNFLWDRTRAIRKDFTFHSQKSPEEMKDLVYCFETITRFHATSLHLLSRKGFANDDFDYKQEIEQLGRTILSLVEAYDVCREKHVHCENEPEFRAYYLLLNAHDPSIAKRIPTWGKEFWFESEEVQTALSLIQAMEDVREPKGPIKPRKMTTLADTAFTNFFAIVEDPRVSYTMACIASVHFTSVRQCILKNLVRAYARHRDAPRTITASDLNEMLRFDTDDEAVEFADLHGFEFTDWVPEGREPVSEPYLRLSNKRKYVPSPRVVQSYSGTLIERKRGTQSLPYVIYNTIYEEEKGEPEGESTEDEESLFVSQTKDAPPLPPSEESSPQLGSTGFKGFSPFSQPAPTPAAPSILSRTAPANSTAATENKAEVPTATPAFSFTRPTTAATAPNPFAAPLQSQASAPAAVSSTPKPSSILSQPAPSAPATSVLSSAAAPKPLAPTGTFSFLNKSSSNATPTSSSQDTQQPGSTFLAATTSGGDAFTKKPFASLAPGNITSSTPSSSPPTAPSSLPSLGSLGAGTKPPTSFFATTATPQAPAGTTLTPDQGAKPGVPSVQTTATQAEKPQLSAASQPGPRVPSALPQPAPTFSFGGDSSTTRATPQPLFQQPPTLGVQPPQPPAPPVERDLMGDFTKWFVNGDDGLLEQFIDVTVQDLVLGAFQQFEAEEVERQRKEEDEQSWREALEHHVHRLGVKYFYRWREAARNSSTKRILRQGKEKIKAFREEERSRAKREREEAEKAAREERRAAKRRVHEDGLRLSLLAASAGSLQDKKRRRRDSSGGANGVMSQKQREEEERMLLASGIFSGMSDERAAARQVVDDVNGEGGGWPVERRHHQFPNPPVSESELEFEPRRSAMGRDYSPASASDFGSSVNGGKKEGWKTRSLREKLGLNDSGKRRMSGSSFGGGSSVDLNLNDSISSSTSRYHRKSLPAAATNFSSSVPPRKRPLSFMDGRPASAAGTDVSMDDKTAVMRKSVSGGNLKNGLSKSIHWDMRARGLVPTPDGNWVPESIVKANLANRSRQERRESNDEIFDDNDSDSLASASNLQQRLAALKQSSYPASNGVATPSLMNGGSGVFSSSLSMAPPPIPSQLLVGKRKRYAADEAAIDHEYDEDGEDLSASHRQQRPPSKKRSSGTTQQLSPSPSSFSDSNNNLRQSTTSRTSAMVEDTQRMLRELRETMDQLDADQPFFNEQLNLLGGI